MIEEVETGIYYKHNKTGMVIEVIERINNKRKTFPLYKVIKQGHLGDAWINKFKVGHMIGITHITDNKLNRNYSIINQTIC